MKQMQNIQIEEVNGCTGVSSWNTAVKFVYDHRNVLATSSRRYKMHRGSNFFVIKEITKFNNEVNYWFWKLYRDHYVIYKINHRPTKQEMMKIWELINKNK